MIIEDLRNADFTDIGSSPASVRNTLLGLVLVLILFAGYFLLIDDKKIEVEQIGKFLSIAECAGSRQNRILQFKRTH